MIYFILRKIKQLNPKNTLKSFGLILIDKNIKIHWTYYYILSFISTIILIIFIITLIILLKTYYVGRDGFKHGVIVCNITEMKNL